MEKQYFILNGDGNNPHFAVVSASSGAELRSKIKQAVADQYGVDYEEVRVSLITMADFGNLVGSDTTLDVTIEGCINEIGIISTLLY